MKFDMVHDVQNAYRKVLNAMSRPGLIENLEEESLRIDIEIDFYKATFAIMNVLLDNEVSFKVLSENREDSQQLLKQITNSKVSSVEAADYIFILKDENCANAEEAISKSKIGDLIDPHKSATIVIEVERLSNDKGLKLKGPGIENETYAKVETNINWIDIRKDKNAEYPLGIDIIFIDKSFNIMCLPRTTQVSKEVN